MTSTTYYVDGATIEETGMDVSLTYDDIKLITLAFKKRREELSHWDYETARFVIPANRQEEWLAIDDLLTRLNATLEPVGSGYETVFQIPEQE